MAGQTPVLVHNVNTGGSGCGPLEGRLEYDVKDPETGNLITDIDHIHDDVLWEEKSALYGDESWMDKHVGKKLEKYLAAREQLPDFYKNSPVGFRFTNANIDPRFKTALGSYFDNIRLQYPNVDIRLVFGPRPE